MKKKLPDWLVLTMIACVAAILLAGTNMITRGVIAEHEQAAARAAYQALMPEATAFNKIETQNGSTIFEAVKDGEKIGYTGSAVTKGFGGEIEVTIGTDTAGVLTGISVGGSNFAETAGLGAKAKEPAFTDQFAGMSYPVDLKKNGGQVDAITGATITSKAVVAGVNQTMENMSEEGLLTLTVPEKEEPKALQDGVYTVSANGVTSAFDITVSVKDGAIESVVVGETDGQDVYFLGTVRQNEGFVSQFEGATWTIDAFDTVSGATVSSNAVMEAVNEAIMQAAGGAGEDEALVLKDGTYTVQGKGQTSTFEVTVTITGGAVESVTIGETDDRDVYFLGTVRQNDGFVSQFAGMTGKVTDIDTVSGATVSSNAVMEAVNKALEEAAE